jgi:hypothetical protein
MQKSLCNKLTAPTGYHTVAKISVDGSGPPAILNLEYGYRYRRKGANLSDINCFRVKEIEMSEKLSFDWFIAKIHEVFDRLPDYRKFSPNLRYSGKEAVLGAFAQPF